MTTTHYTVLAVGWSVAIAVAYSIPPTGLPAETILQVDKLAHFVMFLGFGFLWMHALHPRRPGTGRKATSPLRASLLVGVGVVISVLAEVYQSALPHRTAEPYDAAANVLGLLLSVGGFWWWYPSSASLTQKEPHN